MKKLNGVVTIALLFLTACSSEGIIEEVHTEVAHAFDADEWPQKWQLMEMTDDMANTPPTTGEDMAWQEWYILYKDGRFSKTREWNQIITESTGIFTWKSYNNQKYIEFTHDVDNDLVGSCMSRRTESLHVTSETTLTGTWLICDGPGLVYERVKYNGRAEEQ